MPDTLAQKIKAKYPGVYDDLSDSELEAKITAKYPGVYDDIPKTAAGAGGAMNFAIVNGQRVPVDDGPLDAVKGFVQNVNPIPAIQSVGKALIPEAAARMAGAPDAASYGPVNAARGMLAAQNNVKQGADAAWAAGDYQTAIRKYADWLLPIIGPAMDASADKMQAGQTWRGAGEALGLGAAIAGPKALEVAQVKVPAVAKNANPVEAAAVQFGEQRGIPIDAATATGNPFVRNVQTATANTPLGSIPAMRGQAAQTSALQRVGRELSDSVYPDAVTPEQAGEGLRQSLNFQVRKQHGRATEAYDRLRRYEADPELAEQVPDPAVRVAQTALDQEAQRSIGRAPSPEEWAELRRMREELDSQKFQSGGLVKQRAKTLEEETTSTYVPRSGGAAVYHDIMQAAPGTSQMTRAEVQTSIEQALASGRFTNAAKGALDVAQQRLRGSRRVSSPTLPPSAGAVETPTVSMMLPADVRAAKAALRPVYDRLMRQLPVTQQRSSPGLKAIENIVNGPDHVPVTILDGDLSAIKGIARGADLPELRDVSQGLAAKAVAELDGAVRDAVAKAGPDAVKTLEEGRAATRTKYAVSDVLGTLRDEPVQAFNQAVYAKDAGIDRLRDLAKHAPAEMPRLGRAYLDDLLAKATADGGFDKAQTVQASWENLGPQTKRLLFKEPGQVQALDNYFRLAKLINKNPNPSGTALVGTSLGSVQGMFFAPIPTAAANASTWAISALLRNPKAVRMFTRGTTLMLGPGKLSKAAMASGVVDVLQAARVAGVGGRSAPAVPVTGDPAGPQDRR